MSAGSQPIDNVGSLGIYKEEDTVDVNSAPHYLLKGWRGLNLSTHMSFICKCCRPSRYVPYKGTSVPYNEIYGAPDQGQMLDV